MKRMLMWIAVALAVGVVVVLGYAATRPDTFTVERSITIAASAAGIHPHLDDFHRWRTWSPWEKLDPDMERTYGGAPRGVGATYAWKGNDAVGSGRMEITSASTDRVTMTLEFSAPMQARNTVDFILTPVDGGTSVTWSMRGDQPFFGKLMSLFFDMDALIGRDFERGLADLQSGVESGT